MSTPMRLVPPAALLLAVTVAACSSGTTSQSGITTSSSSTTSSAATSATSTATADGASTAPTTGSATTPPPRSSAPAAPAAPAYPESQQEYTSELVRAWGVGDRARGARYATDAAIRRLYGTIDRGGPNWSLMGCDNAGPRPACTFSNPGQGQRLVLFYDSAKLAQPRAVVDAEFLSDNPASATQ